MQKAGRVGLPFGFVLRLSGYSVCSVASKGLRLEKLPAGAKMITMMAT